MTADNEKLKALALAISKTDSFVGALDALHDFQREACPATVLELCNENAELRAEVAKLRAEVAAGAARQSGNTNLDGIRKYCTGEIENSFQLSTVEDFVRLSDVERLLGSAPAAGTDQNAERYRLLIAGDIIDVDDEFLSSDCTEWEVVPPSARTVFLGCRYNPNMFKPARRKVAAIEARTKAGKETGP